VTYAPPIAILSVESGHKDSFGAVKMVADGSLACGLGAQPQRGRPK
jgi:hypothetical protein